MTRFMFGRMALVALMSIAVSAPLFADKTGKKTKKSTFSVVLAGSEVKVLESSEVDAARKAVDASYKAKMSAYQEAKKSAKESKTRFTEKLPKRPTFRIIKSRIETREKADELALSSRTKMDPFVVLFDGSTYHVTRKLGVPEVERTVADEYKQALSDWEAAKAEAKSKKQQFREKRPAKPTVKTVATGFSTEELAKAKVEELEAKRTKSSGKSRKAPKPAPEPKPDPDEDDL